MQFSSWVETRTLLPVRNLELKPGMWTCSVSESRVKVSEIGARNMLALRYATHLCFRAGNLASGPAFGRILVHLFSCHGKDHRPPPLFAVSTRLP